MKEANRHVVVLAPPCPVGKFRLYTVVIMNEPSQMKLLLVHIVMKLLAEVSQQYVL